MKGLPWKETDLFGVCPQMSQQVEDGGEVLEDSRELITQSADTGASDARAMSLFRGPR